MEDLKEAIARLLLINRDINSQLQSFNHVLEKYIHYLEDKSKNW